MFIDHSHLKKKKRVYIYTYKKKIIYIILTYFDHPNKNSIQHDLRIIRI